MAKDIDISQEEKLKSRIKFLESQYFTLHDKYESINEKLSELLNYSDTAIVDSDKNLKIIDSQGNVEKVFGSRMRRFETGNNLVDVIQKLTKNTNIKKKSISTDEHLEIQTVITNFMNSQINEKEFSVLGETDDGEMFLLVWKMKRLTDKFRSYFKIIPSNAIVRAAQEHHQHELKNREEHLIQLLAKVPEGVTLLDNMKKIIFMNEPARITHLNHKIANAPVEGRSYQEIFVTEEKDNIRIRMEKLEFCIKFKKSMRFVMTTQKVEMQYYIYPIIDHGGNVINSLIISSPMTAQSLDGMKEVNFRLVATLKQMTNEMDDLQEHIREITTNNDWLKQKYAESAIEIFKEIGDTITILEKIPLPICVLSLPGYRYEYANQAFCELVNVPMDEIKDKKDDSYFFGNDLIAIESKNFETVNKDVSVTIDSEHLIAKQVVLKDLKDKPKKILRIFTKIKNK